MPHYKRRCLSLSNSIKQITPERVQPFNLFLSFINFKELFRAKNKLLDSWL